VEVKRYGVPTQIVDLIRESYRGYVCRAVHEGCVSEPIPVWTGVRQGCILSPINDSTINSFMSELQDELWDQVMNTFNTNETFNLFLDTLIKHFEATFPITYINHKNRQNNWISKGIRISCKKKRDLYTLCRNNRDNTQMTRYYKKYCRILNKVIKQAKRQYIHNIIASSFNKAKTAWRIIRENSGVTPHLDIIDDLNCGNSILRNPKDIAHAFNNHFSNISISLGTK